MAWSTPKTNWVGTDYFNVEDYNRIVGNLNYLKSIMHSLFKEVDYEFMEENKLYSSMIYASEINAIESNLRALNNGSYNLVIGEGKGYSPNGATQDYVELNRIENAILSLYNKLTSNIEIMERLSYRLGNMKGIKV